MNVILAGMPGSGKTTVSLILGKKLDREVVDTDAIVVEKYGVIAEIFETYGEEHFRNLETEAVKEACTRTNAVISTGGGCLLRQENCNLFKKCGKIFYLKTQIKTLVERTRGDTTRPLLAGDTEKRLAKLLHDRAHIYESAADFTVETDGLTPEEVANAILEYIK